MTPELVMDLHELEAVLRQRRDDPPPGSYSATLLADPARASRKLMEEAYEFSYELTRPGVDPARVAEEGADLLFHLLAALVGVGVALDAVLEELQARRATSTRRPERAHTGGRDSASSGEIGEQ